jgi:hypothetical protein
MIKNKRWKLHEKEKKIEANAWTLDEKTGGSDLVNHL